jgi:hypothetical protein
MSESVHLSVLLNKISKANRMIVEYALEKPGDYGRSAEDIANNLAWWGAHRDKLVAEYNARYTP